MFLHQYFMIKFQDIKRNGLKPKEKNLKINFINKNLNLKMN